MSSVTSSDLTRSSTIADLNGADVDPTK